MNKEDQDNYYKQLFSSYTGESSKEAKKFIINIPFEYVIVFTVTIFIALALPYVNQQAKTNYITQLDLLDSLAQENNINHLMRKSIVLHTTMGWWGSDVEFECVYYEQDENNFIIYGLYRSSLKKFVYPKIKVVGIEEEDCYGG